jgi:ketosteroid isomerase-like protein
MRSGMPQRPLTDPSERSLYQQMPGVASVEEEEETIMTNVDSHRAAHAAFNRRDYEDAVKNLRDDIQYTDHPRNISTKGPVEFVDWLKGWAAAFSDAQVADVRYIDGGDHTVALFQGRGTNDGAMGPMPATGKRMDLPYCEVLRFDAEGRVVAGEIFYDTVTMMVQLGLMEPLQAS